MIIQFLHRHLRKVATLGALTILNQIVSPNLSYGLTGGPSQPEVQSFEPVGTSDMVDVFSGDFNYNIPLLDVGGYPINIAYHGGVGMDQEASWVGLGWNLNPGVINRNMRGIPDDFKGADLIKRETHVKPNVTVGTSIGGGLEVFGLPKSSANFSFGITNNNYRGWGYEAEFQPEFSIGKYFQGEMTFGFSNSSGISIDANMDMPFGGPKYRKKNEDGISGKFSIGTGINSRSGMKTFNFGAKLGGSSGKSMNKEIGGTSTWNFGTQTYTTKITTAQRQFGLTLRGKAGTEILGLHPNTSISGFVSVSQANNEVSMPAYGYMYEDYKKDEKNPNEVLLDFNRENENGLNDHTSNLPLTNHTFDIYSVAGQGVGGSYRTYRGDIGILHDHKLEYGSFSGSGGLESGIGNLAHTGLNISGSYTKTSYGMWEQGNGLNGKLGFVKQSDKSNTIYEPFYFKPAGEMSVIDESFYNLTQGNQAVQAELTPVTGEATGKMVLKGDKTSIAGFVPDNTFAIGETPAINSKTKRDARNKVMSVMTNQEGQFCFESNIFTVPVNSKYTQDKIARQSIDLSSRQAHHVREVTITNEDGSRYIYGIPAYNNVQIEKTFNISKKNGSHINSTTCSNGQAYYTPGEDSRNNRNGEDEFFTSTEIPAYAHSYLLTSVVSPDYVDVKNDGITDDDLGTAVKFNYTRVHTNYKWRTPYNTNTVNYQEGLKSNRTDDKGSVIYGEKEVWHVHSIESKNQVALFIISQREDALGVANKDGGKDLSQRSYKLDRIELYNKQDLINHPVGAEPIKIVYFEYDYSLCPNVENNSGANYTGNENKGKLTLKKIYFSYGKSNKGKFSPYKFKYSDFNPAYNLKGYDVWGNYLPAPSGASCDHTGPALNAEFPYTPQSKTEADQYATAWALTEVFLPSGGSIKVDYESDDYAYVQDRKAMQMMKIEGFGKVSSGVLDAPAHRRGFLHRNKNGEGLHQDALLFKLPQSINTGTAQGDKDKLLNDYLNGIKDLQVTVFVDIDGNNNYEYVKCYVELDLGSGYGVTDGGATGWVSLKKTSYGDKRGNNSDKINPVSLAVWNFTRMNCDFLVNPQIHLDGSNNPSKNKSQILSIAGMTKDLMALFSGYNKTLFLRGFGSIFKPDRSWVRMNAPTQIKYGGGQRVKKITINDNWSEMGSANTGAANMEYGQEYTYTTEENGKTISSGVASNEPSVSDENPFKQPRTVRIENKLVPDEYLLQEEPVGESFFPGAGIGYSKVTVKNIGRSNVNRTGTGKEVSEFYTCKDFPTIVRETNIRIEKKEPPKIAQIFTISGHKTISASQGYTIELNDMHGKPKRKFSYREGATTPYAGTEYKYKTKATDKTQLDNVVPVIFPNGQIQEKTVGLDFDVSQDMNEYTSTTTSGGVDMNLDNIYIVLSVLPIPSLYPSFKRNKIKVRTSVTTKIINRYGVLEKIIAYQEGSSIETQNRLWDAQTGQVLLSSVQNEFEDNIYNFNYPAHWAYEGMGMAYKNTGLILRNVKITQDKIVLPGGLNVNDFLVPGDEVIVSSNTSFSGNMARKAWVYDGNDGILNLIDKEGKPWVEGTESKIRNLKVIRSGRRNQQGTSIGSVSALSNPATGSTLSFSNVLNSEMAEFSDQWQTHLDYISKLDCGDNFTDTGQELIDLLKYLGQNNKLFKRYIITNANLEGSDYITDDIEKHSEGTWQSYGNTGTNPYTYIDDTCQNYRIKLSKKENAYVDMHNNTKYYATTSPYGLYVLKYEARQYNVPLYNSGTSTWTPSWLSGSKLQSRFGANLNSLLIKPVSSTKIEIWINDACVITIESDKPFTSILDLFEMIALDKHTLKGNALIKGEGCATDTAEVQISVPCFNVSNCEWNCRNLFVEGAINPYTTNMRGVWRPKRSLKYLDNRNYQSATVNTRSDGTYSSYTPYWQYSSTTKKHEAQNTNNKWVSSAEVTKYSPFGPELETKDALGRYSAALYGYNYTHPVAVASNSKYQQIAFDGFEEYDYMNTYAVNLCKSSHFNFRDAIGAGDASIDGNEAHSGKNSLKVPASHTALFSRQLTGINVTPYSGYSENVVKVGKLEDNLGYFAPEAGKYVVGAWLKCATRLGDTTYSGAYIKVTLEDASANITSFNYLPKGNIIEGWQRIEGILEIPAGTKYLRIELVSGSQDAWFDDVRIHPNDGNMATYVYDNRTLRLMAELDANNYATFYEYSNEGELMRVKKETLKGVQTLKEVRSSSVKKPYNGIFNQ